jgi:S1-C subfamily serine protease
MHLSDPLAQDRAATDLATPSQARPRSRLASRLAVPALCVTSAFLGSAGTMGALALAMPAAAAEDPVTSPAAAVTDAQGDNQTVIDVAAAASPAVVTIEVVTQADPNRNPFGGMVGGSGSGFIIEPDGLILTNRHVVDAATDVTVTLADGSTYDGTVKGVDTFTDLALVKIDASDLPTVPLGDSSALQVGQLAIAIGSPLGTFPGSVTSGIVSGLDRTITASDPLGPGANVLRHLIQTDAAINPGNSGGPLLDGDGKVIGVNTAEAGMAQGIGFAVPIDLAKAIVDQVKSGEEIARPWLGIQYVNVDAKTAEDEDLPVQQGAWITQPQGSQSPAVVAGSPAADAGLQDGDIVTAIDGQAIDATHPLDLVLLQHAPGDTVTLTVQRGDQSLDIEVTLGTRPADLSQ